MAASQSEENEFIGQTQLVNKLMPKSWTCPNCRKRNRTNKYANEVLMENFLYLEHCDDCGYVYTWTLKLTEDFKKQVIDFLLKEGK